ncbi:hypothetical protein CAOG_07188 [Capsaspora owczarzaki ATCC 30864]|uniref:Large ribosomal subunit protein mL43 n=1 Tax=Capsaspora owczarzaki (strain ATCC 30864) TaxID=595528 RepID=A0A0D2X500_CAPO3|nr:hypothetical protein CAOG_07188 [Capsaspora owczarzaki ATCC 30864]KJE96944.1 hypothetical protein CAOG_007188 [Capsaspora owczarzaki ATCC 30864]|eukprot:XP_004343912.1 hypothetical protein CAOG_07188 [Capsaspora owczarzaki ATCC 30864]
MASVAMSTVGVGRYIPQLRKLTLHYCRNSPSSIGMREYIDRNVVKLAQDNPAIVIQVLQRKGKHPYIEADFLAGASRTVGARNLTANEVEQSVERLRGLLGRKNIHLFNRQSTQNPSVQGTWQPFLNRLAFQPLEAVGRLDRVRTFARNPHTKSQMPSRLQRDIMLGQGEETEKLLIAERAAYDADPNLIKRQYPEGGFGTITSTFSSDRPLRRTLPAYIVKATGMESPSPVRSPAQIQELLAKARASAGSAKPAAPAAAKPAGGADPKKAPAKPPAAGKR